MESHGFLIYLAGVPLLGILAQWAAWRLQLPSILLLLGVGIGLGHFVNPDELLRQLAGTDDASFAPRILFPIISLSVAVILFEGGMTLKISEFRESGSVLLLLVTIGALVSWLLTGVAAYFLLGLDPRLCALLGAVLVVTGPTVVAPLLRHIRPSRRIGSIVKWEGIVIDPVGAILAVLVFEMVFSEHGGHSFSAGLLLLGKTILVGSVIGGLTALVLIQLLKRYLLPDFLHGVAFLTVALGVFALSNICAEESGLVTVTVLGLLLVNQKSASIEHIIEFKEHLRVFLISCLFIVLGSRLALKDIHDLGWGGVGFLAAIIFVVRPIAVYASTLLTSLDWRERIFLGFLAPRGIVAAAVTSVFALQVAAHFDGDAELKAMAERLVPITFLVIVGTVAIYGLAAAPLARQLRVAEPNPQGLLFGGAEAWVRKLAEVIYESGFQVLLVDTNYRNISSARVAGLPAECASILSEHVAEELDLGGIGRMLSVTPNDEVNALASRVFAHSLGRENVFQLTPLSSLAGRKTSMSERLRGRILFDETLDHDELGERIERTHEIKKTRITEEFSFEQFRELYGDAVILFVITEENQLQIVTSQENVAPKVGQTIIALVPQSNQREKPSSGAGAAS